jgi:hypothetical protein
MSIQAALVGDVVHRIHHEVHRHQIDAAAFHTQCGHPLRQGLAHLLDQREQVVRAVDLVDLAGLGMADYGARAIDAIGNLALVADQAFGIVLGAEIRIGQALGLVEHVFAEHARVQACRGDGTGVVEATGLDAGGELDGVACAFDVGNLLRFGVRRQVVDGRQMEEVLDLAGQGLGLRRRKPELGLGKVAGDGDHPAPVPAHLAGDGIELLFRPLAHQDMDAAFALQQLADQETAQEAGSACHEIAHCPCPDAKASRSGPNG